MKNNEEKREEDMNPDEDIVRNNCQIESRRNIGGNDISSDGIETKRRRMSKKERKALKQRNKERNLKRKFGKFNEVAKITNSGQDVNEDIEAEEERIRLECLNSYDAINIPKHPLTELISPQNRDGQNTEAPVMDAEGGCRTLGKWFPNAIAIKTISYTNTGQLVLDKRSQKKQHMDRLKEDLIVRNPRSSLVLFYQYTTSDGDEWDRRQLQLLITYLSSIARHRNIGGRIRVAPEGVNATLSAVDTKQCTAKAALRHVAEDLRRFDQRVFSHTDFKFLDDLPADRHFKEIKILPVQELVFYDIGEDDAPLIARERKNVAKIELAVARGGGGGGIHLDAKAYHEMLKKDNTVVIDVRNNYETILGRFDGQQQHAHDVLKTESALNRMEGNLSSSRSAGAEYIDPQMRKSTDFKRWLQKAETQEKLSNKTILMYCTGGIRCERASAYLKTQMGEKVEGVYQVRIILHCIQALCIISCIDSFPHFQDPSTFGFILLKNVMNTTQHSTAQLSVLRFVRFAKSFDRSFVETILVSSIIIVLIRSSRNFHFRSGFSFAAALKGTLKPLRTVVSGVGKILCLTSVKLSP